MKKIILVLFTVLFCSVSSVYAKSDLQLGLEVPAFNFSGADLDLKNASVFSININNHNFFGEKTNFGFSEYVSFSPLTSDLFEQFPGFNVSAFAGPSFKFSPSSTTDLILSAGVKYFLNYTRKVQNYPKEGEEKTLSIIGTKAFSAYSASVDFQAKFFADRKCSFVIGMPLSFGFGSEEYIERIKTSNPVSHYKTLSNTSDAAPYLEIGLPYFMFSLNF